MFGVRYLLSTNDVINILNAVIYHILYCICILLYAGCVIDYLILEVVIKLFQLFTITEKHIYVI